MKISINPNYQFKLGICNSINYQINNKKKINHQDVILSITPYHTYSKQNYMCMVYGEWMTDRTFQHVQQSILNIVYPTAKNNLFYILI